MPLVESVLKSALKTRIQSRLIIEFKKPEVKNSLIKRLDGGALSGKISGAKNINKALSNIDLGAKSLSLIDGGANFPPAIKRLTSNEWSNAISDSICEWMSDTIAPILAEELSTIIANEVTKYIKTATVITPPGQIVTGTAGTFPVVAATTSPSSPSQIL